MGRPPLRFPDPPPQKKIMIYPTTQNATVMRHPVDGQLKSTGSLWTEDGLTMRVLLDGSATTNAALAWRDPTPPIDVTVPPPHATGVPDNPPEPKITRRKDLL